MTLTKGLNAVSAYFQRQGCNQAAQDFARLAEIERVHDMARAAAKLPKMTNAEVQNYMNQLREANVSAKFSRQ